MIEHQLGKTQTPKLWTDVHPFEFAVVRPKQLNTHAADGRAVVTDEKECHPLCDQLLYTVAMSTFPRIERRQVCFKLLNQRSGVGGVGSFCSYGGFHTSGADYSCVLPIVKPLAPFLSVIPNLKTNAIRVGKEHSHKTSR